MNDPVYISPHAVARYIERVKPHLEGSDPQLAVRELLRLIAMAEGDPIPGVPPALAHLQAGQDDDCCLTLAPGIWGLLRPQRGGDRPWVLVTVLTSSGYSEGAREHVSRRKRKGRHARRTATETNRHSPSGKRKANRRPRFDPEF